MGEGDWWTDGPPDIDDYQNGFYVDDNHWMTRQGEVIEVKDLSWSHAKNIVDAFDGNADEDRQRVVDNIKKTFNLSDDSEVVDFKADEEHH